MTTSQTNIADVTADIDAFYTQLGDVFESFDLMLNATLSLAISGDLSLSEDQARAAGEYVLSGSPAAAFILTWPATIARQNVAIVNATGQAATLTYGSGLTVSVPAGEARAVTGDRTNFQERAASLGSAAFAVQKDGAEVIGAAAFLNFLGPVTLAANGSDGVDITVAAANGVSIEDGDGQVGGAAATGIIVGTGLEAATAADGKVELSITGLVVDPEGNPIALAATLPLFGGGELLTQTPLALNFADGLTAELVDGTVNVSASAAVGTLAGLSDVSVPSPQNNQLLRRQGSLWSASFLTPSMVGGGAAAGLSIRVNDDGNRFEFFTPGTGGGPGATSLEDLTDVSAAASVGLVLTSVDDGEDGFDYAFQAPSNAAFTGLAGVLSATTRTATAADVGQLVQMTSGVFTLPSDATESIPIGSVIHLHRAAASTVEFAAGAGATVLKPIDFGLRLRLQDSLASATKVAADTWLVAGDLSEVQV
ncbi:MAG: hypothetical protein AAF713_20560 [Pseudomonadota bacterium]